MKCSLVVSNFLEEISNFLEEIASLSHSVVFLYFFALIAEEGFLISPFLHLFSMGMVSCLLYNVTNLHPDFIVPSIGGMITHPEPDILEGEFKWALGNITTKKASGGDGIPVELFQILKDDAVKVLHSICQQIWRTQQRQKDWQSFFSFHSKEKQCQRMCKLPHNCTHLTR